MSDKLTILGSRGSMCISGPEYEIYGGNSICIVLETDRFLILLDAGSGLLCLDPDQIQGKEIYLFLSHFHLDHCLGIPLSPIFFRPGQQIHIVTTALHGSARLLLDALMKPPLWPVGKDVFSSSLSYHVLDTPYTGSGPIRWNTDLIPDLSISWMSGNHPGGCAVFQLQRNNTRIVFATDLELAETNRETLTAFVGHADWMFLDGQYTESDFPLCRGFGHSSMSEAADFLQGAGIANGRLIHHDPKHNDTFLQKQELLIRQRNPVVSFAKEREVILL